MLKIEIMQEKPIPVPQPDVVIRLDSDTFKKLKRLMFYTITIPTALRDEGESYTDVQQLMCSFNRALPHQS